MQCRYVPGGKVVVHDAPVFSSVDPHDIVVVQVLEPRPVPGFSLLPVRGALCLDHVLRDHQRDLTVDHTAAVCELSVAMLNSDLISEESCRAGAGMSYQGLIRVQFQGEGLPQEERQFLLDYLGFGFRPDEP